MMHWYSCSIDTTNKSKSQDIFFVCNLYFYDEKIALKYSNTIEVYKMESQSPHVTFTDSWFISF